MNNFGSDDKARVLQEQLTELSGQLQDTRNHVADIAQNPKMADTLLHLDNVISTTENAALTIIDAAGAIGPLLESTLVSPELRNAITEQINIIFEASSFQDISGQRIKNAIHYLNTLQAELKVLSQSASGYKRHEKSSDEQVELLNGPQLDSDTPNQDEIDQLFANAK